ncbi:hypothetical protein CSAL01_07691 [Colletotrichum salicis]|uniref:Uncharacterized protein n=1 Tax=Colletotrichum salicis TaxID=1209931 RepID=A0A135U011_9PEZI|nr:hypothetical protein CSAL01_07691 [Colletotrichum salicis]
MPDDGDRPDNVGHRDGKKPRRNVVDMEQVVTALRTSDRLTASLAEIRRHIDFTIPDDEVDGRSLTKNLLTQGYNPPHKLWHPDRRAGNEYNATWKGSTDQLTEGNRFETEVKVTILRSAAVHALAFATESSAWARAFGDFLFQEKPGGVDNVTALKELRNQAASRAAVAIEGRVITGERVTTERVNTPYTQGAGATAPAQPGLTIRQRHTSAFFSGASRRGGSDDFYSAAYSGIANKASMIETQASDDHLGASHQRNIDDIFDASQNSPGNLDVAVPRPAAHVIDDLEDDNSDKHPGQRLPLANYIHPHVTVSLTQQERPDGEAFHTLVLGLTESTSTLRCSRHGLLQAYDMAVCWASEVDKDGVSYSLRRAFDGCHTVTESFAAGTLRIEEMARLEKQIERLAPQSSQFDMVTERIKEWMERRRYKAQYTSQGAWNATLCKWWEDEHDDVGGLGREELKEACLQAIKAKMKEWKETKQSISEPRL